MRIETSIAELWAVWLAFDGVPPFIRSIDGENNTVRITIDLREVPDAPSALKLAARLVPIVRGTVQIESYTSGTAILAVEASAGGLPAHKLLGFIEAPLAAALHSKNLPANCVRVLPDARIAINVQALLEAQGPKELPGMQVTDLGYSSGVLRAVIVP